jgi:hypothetical protein
VTDPDVKTYLELADKAVVAILDNGQDPKEYGKTEDAKLMVEALERLETKYPEDKEYFDRATVEAEAFANLSPRTLRLAALGITTILEQYLESTGRLEK